MPTYCYRVMGDGKATDEVVELTYPMGKRPRKVRLEDGRTAVYDFAATARHVRPEAELEPVASRSLGTIPSDVARLRKLEPNRTFLDDGRMVLPSKPSERKRLFREMGVIDMN
jgi:hypothetical protein